MAAPGLAASAGSLVDTYDVAMLDLDGVVYVGDEAVRGAAPGVAKARARGLRLAFVTNNASRTPDKVAEKIRAAGIEVAPDDIVTSAQAAARLLRDRFGQQARVVVLGATGLVEAVRSAGLEPVGAHDEAVALVTGYGPDVVWRDVMRAAVRIRDGLVWVASNTDLTIPTGYGVAPGHGVMVRMLRDFTGIDPQVAGKPAPPLLEATIARTGAQLPLMVGDRLDTDIEGATNVGIDSLLVLTGVTGLPELVAAEPHARPSYLSCDLRGLLEQHPVPTCVGDTWSLGGWSGSVERDRLVLTGDGQADDWWRVTACAAWQHLDTSGRVVDVTALEPPEPAAGR